MGMITFCIMHPDGRINLNSNVSSCFSMAAPLPNDRKTLAGLRNKDNRAYDILYKFYFPVVESFILKNNGNRDDARDIFQETILVLLNKVPTEEFELTSSLKTYLFSISSNLWLKRLRQARQMHTRSGDVLEHDSAQGLASAGEIACEVHEEPTPAEKAMAFLSRITLKCQALLRAIFFLRKDIHTITRENGYTSVHNAQNQKYKCLEQARREAKSEKAP
jgi:RNA polymerase sigma factor (sigma-70 family)